VTTLAQVNHFLEHKRIAFVGVSRNPKDFSRQLFRDMEARGYDMVPVNLGGDEIEGKHCFSSVRQIEPPVEAALVMTPPRATAEVVRDCHAGGIHEVWLHRGGGQGSVSEEAVRYGSSHGMEVVAGFCPYMFLPETAFFHRAHGFMLKLSGRYPRRA
jgi:uncharacterized protein